eukprot:360663-Chlamydomonas_euryale.AAC.4
MADGAPSRELDSGLETELQRADPRRICHESWNLVDPNWLLRPGYSAARHFSSPTCHPSAQGGSLCLEMHDVIDVCHPPSSLSRRRM